MKHLPYSQIQKGSLMVASPEISAGMLFRGVVLICEHNPSGSFGLLLNKPLDLELPEDVIDLSLLANPHLNVRAGGPIQPNQMMLLHSSNAIPDQTLQVCNGVYLGGDLSFLQEVASNPSGPHIQLFFGYCGWGAGQLEREFLDGGWFTHPASAHYVFHTPPEKLWQTILRDMGGKYASLSMIPEDLSLN